MISYVIWIFVIVALFVFGFKLFRKPKLNYDYNDMTRYNKSIVGTNATPLPMPRNRSELDILLQVIADNDNDNDVLNVLTEVYEQLMTAQNELDVLILTLSELLYDKANSMKDSKNAQNIYRASRITKRLAHNLYRRYRIKNPSYTNPKFLQFID